MKAFELKDLIEEMNTLISINYWLLENLPIHYNLKMNADGTFDTSPMSSVMYANEIASSLFDLKQNNKRLFEILRKLESI